MIESLSNFEPRMHGTEVCASIELCKLTNTKATISIVSDQSSPGSASSAACNAEDRQASCRSSRSSFTQHSKLIISQTGFSAVASLQHKISCHGGCQQLCCFRVCPAHIIAPQARRLVHEGYSLPFLCVPGLQGLHQPHITYCRLSEEHSIYDLVQVAGRGKQIWLPAAVTVSSIPIP